MSHTLNRPTVDPRPPSQVPGSPARSRALVCFSHLRWDFVYQRPQHLSSRAARTRRVVYIEESIHDATRPCLETRRDESGVLIITPHLPQDTGAMPVLTLLGTSFCRTNDIHDFVAWYYTPMALEFSRHPRRAATIHDRMDGSQRVCWRVLQVSERKSENFCAGQIRPRRVVAVCTKPNAHSTGMSRSVPEVSTSRILLRTSAAARARGSGRHSQASDWVLRCARREARSRPAQEHRERLQGGSSLWWVQSQRSTRITYPRARTSTIWA